MPRSLTGSVALLAHRRRRSRCRWASSSSAQPLLQPFEPFVSFFAVRRTAMRALVLSQPITAGTPTGFFGIRQIVSARPLARLRPNRLGRPQGVGTLIRRLALMEGYPALVLDFDRVI